jgi:hypothetical protein
MNREASASLELLVVVLLASCASAQPPPPSETVVPLQAMSDTFFSGCAHLDLNSNGEIDPDEPLLGGMTFAVTLPGGGGFGADTSEGECAFIVVPASLPAEAWPVLARMTVPDGAAYNLIGPPEVRLDYPETRADFLFSAK